MEGWLGRRGFSGVVGARCVSCRRAPRPAWNRPRCLACYKKWLARRNAHRRKENLRLNEGAAELARERKAKRDALWEETWDQSGRPW